MRVTRMHIRRETAEASTNGKSRQRLWKSYCSRFATMLGIGLAFLAVTGRAEYLYIANTEKSSVSTYRIADSGALTLIGTPSVAGQWPGSVVVDSLHRFLF